MVVPPPQPLLGHGGKASAGGAEREDCPEDALGTRPHSSAQDAQADSVPRAAEAAVDVLRAVCFEMRFSGRRRRLPLLRDALDL